MAAQSVSCLSNLRQIGLAAQLYSNERVNQQWLLSAWGLNARRNDPVTGLPDPKTNALALYGIPSDSRTLYCPSADPASLTINTHGYGINQNLVMTGRGPGTDGMPPVPWGPINVYFESHANTKITSIRNTAEAVYFMDNYDYVASWWNYARSPASRRHGTVPNNYANILWVDGHASREPGDFKTCLYGTTGVPYFVHP